MAKRVAKGKDRTKANGEGTVYQRGRDDKWVAELTIGWDGSKRKIIRSLGFDRKKGADDWLTTEKGKRLAGTMTEPTKETLAGFVVTWLDTVAIHEVGESTMRIYRNMFRWYIDPGIGKTALAQLKPQEIQHLCHTLQNRKDKPISARTVQLMLTTLRRALQQAVEWNLLARNPVDAVRRPKAERKEMGILTEDQVVRFLAEAKQERLHALFVLQVTMGLRRGETLALRWQDVDLDKGLLTVARTIKCVLTPEGKETWAFGVPKTKTSIRTVPMPDDALVALRLWRKNQAKKRVPHSEELVFTTTTGTPINPRNIRDRELLPILERAGLPRIRLHDLRHTWVTMLRRRKVDPTTIQKMAGHADVRITLGLYNHVQADDMQDAVQRLDTFLKKAKE